MPIATLSEVLQPALRDGYAVAGVVVLGWEDAQAYVQGAEAENTPLILQAGPGCRAYTPLPILAAMFRHLADTATVPVVCHLDHGKTLQECTEAIDHGFSSVMIDGSALPFDDNVALTQSVVAYAAPHGVSVEAELGYVGYSEGAQSSPTDAHEAGRFFAHTGVDALAVSVGNVHLQTDSTTPIDYPALTAIAEQCPGLPLVLHGGSGVAVEDRKTLSRHSAVCKFNVGTELRRGFGTALRASLRDQPQAFDRIALLKPTIGALAEQTRTLLRHFR